MHPTTKQALEIVEEFEKRISALPAGERGAVLKRLTSHVAALNEDVTAVLQSAGQYAKPLAEQGSDASHLRDFI